MAHCCAQAPGVAHTLVIRYDSSTVNGAGNANLTVRGFRVVPLETQTKSFM